MPSKARKIQLQNLIEEQKRDAQRHHVFSEKITPQKPPLPYGLTLTEYYHLMLTPSTLTIEEIAGIGKITPTCVSKHRRNAYRKLGPEMYQHWEKVCELFKTHTIFNLPAEGSPLGDSESGEEDPIL